MTMQVGHPGRASAAGVPAPTDRPAVAPRRRRRRRPGWAFVAPFMVVFLFAFVAPIVYAAYLSTFRESMIGGVRYVGFENITDAIKDERLREAVGRVALFLLVQVPIMVVLAAAAALAIDSSRLIGARLFRIGIFLPYAVPGVVAALLWGFMYGEQFGLVNSINDGLGWSIPAPLSSRWVLVAIGNIVTWEYVGYNMLIFYAALQVVPTELYEAAAVDGAGQWRIIRAIKLPAMTPALVIAIVFSIIGSFQLFNEPNILRSLAPNTISTYFTPNMYALNLSFAGQQYNYAAAIALVMGVVTVACARTFQIVAGRRSED